MSARLHSLRQLFETEYDVVLIDVIDVKGSVPRETDAWMLVSTRAQWGTIGGGQLEYIAIEKARQHLATKGRKPEDLKIPLGPQIGQCCGGVVRLRLQRVTPELEKSLCAKLETEEKAFRCVYIFGAGHVGRALASALAQLPVKAILVDTRQAELDLVTGDVEKHHVAIPEALIDMAPPMSAFVAMTHDHALDFLITEKALQRDDAAYVGLIGSKTKRAKFESWFRDQRSSTCGLERLICPIGASNSRDKRPEVIAALVASEIIGHVLTSDQAAPVRAETKREKISEAQ